MYWSVYWDNSYNTPEPLTTALGVGNSGVVEMDFSKGSYALYGSSGSGKSTLLLSAIQSLQEKGAEITVADWKNGVDFYNIKDKVSLICDIDTLTQHLESVCELIAQRQQILASEGVHNISQYNLQKNKESKFALNLTVIDEASLLFDMTGLPKAEKDKITRVISLVQNICRVGRAEGCCCIISTQFASAETLPTAIKSNLIPIVGKCNNLTQSVVCLGSGERYSLPNIPGVFAMRDESGEVITFKAFYRDDL